MLNITGPSTNHLGISLVTNLHLGTEQLTTTLRVRPFSQFFIQSVVHHPSNPFFSNLSTGRSCGTMSNALHKSRYMMLFAFIFTHKHCNSTVESLHVCQTWFAPSEALLAFTNHPTAFYTFSIVSRRFYFMIFSYTATLVFSFTKQHHLSKPLCIIN